MRASLVATLAHIRLFEGGYVNDPRDPGGCTNLGITLPTWKAHGHSRATCADLRKIEWCDAAPIYTCTYWAQTRGDDLPAGVDLLVMDHGVNAGCYRAARLLQETVGAKVDGDIGPKTLAAVQEAYQQDPKALIRNLADARRGYYRNLRQFNTYGKGWLRRVDAAEKAALQLITPEDPTP